MSDLGKNIKYLRKQNKYSQVDLANTIGVSQTSIAHYEAGTRQPTIETLMELSQLFSEPIDALVGNSLATRSKKHKRIQQSDLVDKLVSLLVNKKEDQFMDLLERSVYPFYNFQSMVDQIFETIMYRIGSLWERGAITEVDEHFATNIVRKASSYVGMQNNNPFKSKKAISFTVGSEKHTLGLEMVNACLESKGIDSLYLGSDLPIKSIEKIIKDYDPSYIFISITMTESMNSLVHLVEYINERFKSEITIGIGGQGVQKNANLTKHSNLHILENIEELLELLGK